MYASMYDIKLAATLVRFGRYTVSRKTCFTGHCYTGNSIAAAENIFFQDEKQTCRIITMPARPLKISFTLLRKIHHNGNHGVPV